MECGKRQEATAPIQSLIKLQPWFLSLWWKTCLWQNCSLGSWVCGGRPAFDRTATLVPEFAVEELPLGRTATLVNQFAVEDLPSAELPPWFLHLQWRTCPWAEHSYDDDTLHMTRKVKIYTSLLTNCFSRNPEVHYRPYVSPSFAPILKKIYPVSSNQTTSIKSILIFSSHQRRVFPKGSFPHVYPLKLCIHFWIAPCVLHVLPISVVSI